MPTAAIPSQLFFMVVAMRALPFFGATAGSSSSALLNTISCPEEPHAKAQRRKAIKVSALQYVLSAPLRLCVSILLLLASTLSLPAAEPTLTPTQIARLESLCRVWGTVKFFHPWIVAPPDGKPIDWDAALVETIPLVEKAETADDFRAAIDHLLSALHDPSTRALSSSSVQTDAQQPPVKSALPETKLIEKGGKKILVITATDWRGLGADRSKASGGLFAAAFAEAANAEAVVVDLRRRDTLPPDEKDVYAEVVSSAFRADFAALLKEDITLNAARSRFHCGYGAEQTTPLARPILSRVYYSGLSIGEHAVLRAQPGPGAGKRVVILTNNGTRGVTGLLAALQSSGQVVVLHASSDLSNFSPGTAYTMRTADGVLVNVRTSDCVNADGTVSFVPDGAEVTAHVRGGDATFDTALAIAGGEAKQPARLAARHAAGMMRLAENLYPEMTSPSREYRLLGLFRVWNVMHYFFPYKHLMDRSWDSVLTEFIPRFAEAATPDDYVYGALELLAHLQDSHVSVSGLIAAAASARRLGPNPLVLTHFIGEDLVVIAADASLKDRVNVGDVVLAVDGEAIAERGGRLTKYSAVSTPQALQDQLRIGLLKGPPNSSSASVKLRAPDGAVREATLPREADTAARQRFRQQLDRKTPVYAVLPEGYGYFDLDRLTDSQVSPAFETVKETPALIMDMRGYPPVYGQTIAGRLNDKSMPISIIRIPYWISPDTNQRKDVTFFNRIEPSPLWKYTGRVVVLINEAAISASEHMCFCLEQAAKDRVTFIGTPTTGANGNVTNTSMPGGITVRFTGCDVRHADGRQLQRLGIQPDIRVEPTIAGIVAGKDEVLEAAIKFLNDSLPKPSP